MKPEERIDRERFTGDFGLWPTVTHSEMGQVRVDGQPVRFSETPWVAERGAPCLAEHTRLILTELLDYSDKEVDAFVENGVV